MHMCICICVYAYVYMHMCICMCIYVMYVYICNVVYMYIICIYAIRMHVRLAFSVLLPTDIHFHLITSCEDITGADPKQTNIKNY